MSPWKCLLPVVCLLLAVGAARAEDVDAKERAAKTACLAGDYAKGVAILSELYVSTNKPVFIFNQGRCFEQNHHYEDAISRFREYLRVGRRISRADKADAQKHIADCQDLLARQGDSSSEPDAAGIGRGTSKEAKERAARRACLTGDPVAGVGILTDLFIDTKDTTYLFNQGRCFEQNRRYEDALGRFREYLMKAKELRPEDKAETEKHIAACESYLRDKPIEATKPAPPKNNVETLPLPDSKPPQAVVATTGPSPGRAGSGLRVAGLVLASVGVAGLATGLALNLKANSMSDDLENQWDPSVNSTRQKYKTAAWTGYGAGAACLIGGALLYYLGWQRGDHATSVALLPIAGSDMAGTVLVGAF